MNTKIGFAAAVSTAVNNTEDGINYEVDDWTLVLTWNLLDLFSAQAGIDARSPTFDERELSRCRIRAHERLFAADRQRRIAEYPPECTPPKWMLRPEPARWVKYVD